MPARSQKQQRPWGALLVGVLLLSVAAYFVSRPATDGSSGGTQPGTTDTSQRPQSTGIAAQAPGGVEVQAVPTPQPSRAGAAEAQQRLQHAQDRLATYRAFAKYPPDSRPAREHPDQLSPRASVVRTLPLSAGGRSSEDVHVQLGQDRRELVGDEAARLWVRCEDSLGKALPCVIEQAQALVPQGLPGAAGLVPAPVPFSDDGHGGDEQAGDGTQTAHLQPLALGFARYHGTLRVQLSLRIGHEQGQPFFDLLYTPQPPARFTGQVRESIVEGSLRLSMGVQVSRAGRYFVMARVDDNQGKAVAYLEWNGELAVGPGQVPLWVFGKLIRDERPTLPLVLRDVEGYLFLDDTTPDRAHMARLSGVVHRTAVYSLSEFSDKEWDSEQKRRYLGEYEKDVAEAGAEVGATR